MCERERACERVERVISEAERECVKEFERVIGEPHRRGVQEVW